MGAFKFAFDIFLGQIFRLTSIRPKDYIWIIYQKKLEIPSFIPKLTD